MWIACDVKLSSYRFHCVGYRVFSGEQIYGRSPVLGQTPLAEPENEASAKLLRPYINRNLLSVFHRFKKIL